ncbi:C2H2 zinc-finger protein SERRATE (SE) [Euphorbia peplus]|nr:C2H2 zinc-finger protein SERRATE (SE) [Euphorbia peplus]
MGKKLDSRWQERLRSQDPLEVMTAKEKIEATAVDSLDPYVRKIRDEKYGCKYGCGAKGCTKLFHAAEFVHKHFKLKHPEIVLELTSKLREELYFQNYMKDPDSPGGTPVMQQTLQISYFCAQDFCALSCGSKLYFSGNSIFFWMECVTLGFITFLQTGIVDVVVMILPTQ